MLPAAVLWRPVTTGDRSPASSERAARAAVAALVHRYAELLDAGDLDGVADLFAAATWSSGGRTLTGRAAVRRIYDGVLLYDGRPMTKHVISDLRIDLDGDTASARCDFTVLQAPPGRRLQPVLAGRYHDRFTSDGGTWRFAERTIVTDLAGDLRHHFRPGP
jgi:3-phenylpropionate/cinnamic acid dioxygenase small subunit